MADHPVTATLVSAGARACEAVVAGVADTDTVSITLPVGFVKTANPLAEFGAGIPRYDVTVTPENADLVEASFYMIVWSVAAPELVLFFRATGVGATAQLYILIKNLHSEIS